MPQRSTWIPLVATFVVALAVRLPHLATIPAPTDETDELLLALAIYRDGARPLTTTEPYLGPLFVYLVAGAYRLLGPSFEAGRLVSAVSGALVAPGVYLLGRGLGGPAVGAVAALVASFAFGHVVVGSHIAWPHGAAVTFAAWSLAALAAASRSTRPRAMAALAGGLGALATGAHPTVLALAPGVAAWWLGGDPAAWAARARGAAWAAVGFAVAYLPGLAFVATQGLAPFRERLLEHDYVASGETAWPLAVVQWLDGLVRNVAGPAAADAGDPRIWLVGGLLAVGLVAAARAGLWLPAAAVASAALLMPLAVDGTKLTSLTGLRYTAPALPLAAVAVGRLAAGPWRAGGGRRHAVTAAVAALVALQAFSIAAHIRAVESHGVSGRPVLEVVDGLGAGNRDRDVLFIDDDLDTKLAGGGEVGRAVGALLTLRGVDYEKAKVDKIRWFLANADGARYDLVLSGDAADVLGSEFALTPVREVPVVPGQVSRTGDRWGWYRFGGR